MFLCRFYGVSRSGYYAWRNRPESRRSEENRWLLGEIRRVYAHSRGIYGSPRVNEGLRQDGIEVSKHRVARLMQENDLKGRVVRVTRRQPGLHRFCEGCPNHLMLSAPPEGPNQQWAGDITYLKVKGKYRYLAIIIDLYSRKIVSWSLSEGKVARMVGHYYSKFMQTQLEQHFEMLEPFRECIECAEERGSGLLSCWFPPPIEASPWDSTRPTHPQWKRELNYWLDVFINGFYLDIPTNVLLSKPFVNRFGDRSDWMVSPGH